MMKMENFVVKVVFVIQKVYIKAIKCIKRKNEAQEDKRDFDGT